MSVYACAKCGAIVKLVNGAFVRSCSHTTEPITASATATCVGKGGLKG